MYIHKSQDVLPYHLNNYCTTSAFNNALQCVAQVQAQWVFEYSSGIVHRCFLVAAYVYVVCILFCVYLCWRLHAVRSALCLLLWARHLLALSLSLFLSLLCLSLFLHCCKTADSNAAGRRVGMYLCVHMFDWVCVPFEGAFYSILTERVEEVVWWAGRRWVGEQFGSWKEKHKPLACEDILQ